MAADENDAAVAVRSQQVVEGRRPWYDAEGSIREPIVIGITGGSASGKGVICSELVRTLADAGTTDPQWCLTVTLDSFYKDLPPELQVRKQDYNFDCPDAVDYPALIAMLKDLKQGKRAYLPKYDFDKCKKVGQKVIYGADVILVEGILVFNHPELLKLLDIKIFVDADDDIRLSRRLKRDVKDRGRPIEAVLSQYERFVKPGFHKFILPMKKFADIIIPTSERTQVVVDLIFKRIDKELRDRGWTPKPRPITDSELPKRAYVLPQTEQVKLMQTILCNRETSHELSSLVLEHALSLLPYGDNTVITPTGMPYQGKVFTAKPCGVSVMPAGSCMEEPLRRVCKGIRMGKILIKSSPERGPSLIYVKLPKVMAERHVLLVDPMLQSGATLTMAIRVLLDHNVPQENIVFVTLVASLSGVQDVMRKYPGLLVVTASLDGTDHSSRTGFITPELSYQSQRYFGQ